jgi:replicative DNA helicase
MSFKKLEDYIAQGRAGENTGLPTGFKRMHNEVSIRRGTASVIMGAAGSGKTAVCHQMCILTPFEYCHGLGIPLKIFCFSMEREDTFYRAKWLINKVFQETGELLDIKRVLGWVKDDYLTEAEMNSFKEYKPYFEELDKVLEIFSGPKTPDYIYDTVEKYCLENGEVIDGVYKPHNADQFVEVIIDHAGLVKGSKSQKKATIDDLASKCQELREKYMCAIIFVCQINRNLAGMRRTKNVTFEPTLDDIKETGDIGDMADLVIAMFEPARYGTTDSAYGDPIKYTDPETKQRHFRRLRVLKNTYGVDGIGVGCAFLGQIGLFKELPTVNEIDNWNETDFGTLFKSSGYFYFQN